MPLLRSIQLFYQNPSENSDKFYEVTLTEQQDRHTVSVRWGRRGTVGQTANKITDVSYVDALQVYVSVVREKTAKGYQVMANEAVIPVSIPEPVQPARPQARRSPAATAARPVAHVQTRRKIVYEMDSSEQEVAPVRVVRPTAILPQLLNFIDESEVGRYLRDDSYCAQEKHDGRRRLIQFESGKVTGYNKKGQPVAFPLDFDGACKSIAEENGLSEFVLDGEEVGNTLYVFDILSVNGEDLRSKSYRIRDRKLTDLTISSYSIKLVVTAGTTTQKRILYAKLREEGKEGIVFKDMDAKHTPGRPNNGGPQVKFKFYATASVIVLKHNAKNSIEVGVLDGGNVVSVGNVTTIGHTRPPVGDVVEVRYLYAYRGGCLYQPNFICARDDVYRNECVISQLKYKSGTDSEEECP